MNHNLFTALSALTITSALLIVGLLASHQPARPSSSGTGAPLIESLEADAAGTGETAAPSTRKKRGKRGALSMPYFSFARSLRPGG